MPCWLLGDELSHFCLAGDDFAYVADSRDAGRLASNLFEPHNTHVVPLFRIWTYVLVAAAGRLSYFAPALGLGSYFTFALSLLAMRYLVVRVTGSQVAGLMAMAMLALSTVMESLVVWYSAGQALCAGTAIVATLIALESWLTTARPGGWRWPSPPASPHPESGWGALSRVPRPPPTSGSRTVAAAGRPHWCFC